MIICCHCDEHYGGDALACAKSIASGTTTPCACDCHKADAEVGRLSDFTTAELEAEMQRRRTHPRKPSPAGRCQRCGEVWYYVPIGSHFKPWAFDMQAERFQIDHKDCPLSLDGGGI